jgi:hypothetical protein
LADKGQNKKSGFFKQLTGKGVISKVWLCEEKRLVCFLLPHDQQNNSLFQWLWFF